jgi:hypothetical protein
LRLDAEGKLKASTRNDSTALRHLAGYLAQQTESDRGALLRLLRNVAVKEHAKLGQPIDQLEICRETESNFRKLLLPQPLGTTTGEDIDELYEAISKDERFSA